MALTKEQSEQVKAQLMKQISSFPPEQQKSAKEQIDAMSSEELEEFLIQNNMIKDGGKPRDKQECIFCSIIQGKVPSYKLDENKSSIAILEINPLSPGHSLVLSRKHDKLSSSAFSLANKIGKRIKSKLKASEIKIENSNILGHQAVQIIPIYKGQELKKRKAEERELVLLQEKLKSKPKKKREKKSVIQVSELPKAPRRVP